MSYSIATSIDNGNTWVDDLTKKTSYSKSIVHFNGNYFLIAGDPEGGSTPIDQTIIYTNPLMDLPGRRYSSNRLESTTCMQIAKSTY